MVSVDPENLRWCDMSASHAHRPSKTVDLVFSLYFFPKEKVLVLRELIHGMASILGRELM
jgi:hypothetical protein